MLEFMRFSRSQQVLASSAKSFKEKSIDFDTDRVTVTPRKVLDLSLFTHFV